jgi:hypothetical protein
MTPYFESEYEVWSTTCGLYYVEVISQAPGIGPRAAFGLRNLNREENRLLAITKVMHYSNAWCRLLSERERIGHRPPLNSAAKNLSNATIVRSKTVCLG